MSQIKKFSDNLKVTGGTAIIEGYNYFPNVSHDYNGFKTIFKEIYAAIKEAADIDGDEDTDTDWMKENDILSIRVLSLPIIRTLDNDLDKFVLDKGYIIWNGIMFKAGFQFTFNGHGELFIDEEDGRTDKVTVLSSQQKDLLYDHYTEEDNDEIFSAQTINELNLPLEPLNNEENDEDDEDDDEIDYEDEHGDDGEQAMSLLKIKSIYIPDLNENIEGRIFLANEEEIDHEATYDIFLVEVLDKTKPFGYITVEAIVEEDDGYLDTFANVFERDPKVNYDTYMEIFNEMKTAVDKFSAEEGGAL